MASQNTPPLSSSILGWHPYIPRSPVHSGMVSQNQPWVLGCDPKINLSFLDGIPKCTLPQSLDFGMASIYPSLTRQFWDGISKSTPGVGMQSPKSTVNFWMASQNASPLSPLIWDGIPISLFHSFILGASQNLPWVLGCHPKINRPCLDGIPKCPPPSAPGFVMASLYLSLTHPFWDGIPKSTMGLGMAAHVMQMYVRLRPNVRLPVQI